MHGLGKHLKETCLVVSESRFLFQFFFRKMLFKTDIVKIIRRFWPHKA